MNAQELIDTARALVAGDKGLLAMDESNPTCNKRFAKLGIPHTVLSGVTCPKHETVDRSDVTSKAREVHAIEPHAIQAEGPAKPANAKPPDIASASVPDTLAALHVNPDTGLTHAEVDVRRKEHGYNEVAETKGARSSCPGSSGESRRGCSN